LLCLIFRCSDKHAALSINAIGGDLYPLLIAILFLDKNLPGWNVPNSAYQLINRLNTLEVALHSMNASKHLLQFCRGIIENCDVDIDARPLSHVIGLLAAISRQCENKTVVMDQPGLFHSLVSKFAKSFRLDHRCNFEVAKLLHALAWNQRNKSEMVQKPEVFNLLLQLIHESSMDTCLEALAALRHVTIENFGISKLVEQRALKKFGEALVESLETKELQEASLEVMIHLVCRETAIKLYKNENLLHRLIDLASTKPDTTPAVLAAQVIKRIATYIPISGRGKEVLLEAIIQLTSSTNQRIRYWGVQALVESSQDPACSFLLMRTPVVAKVLSNLLVDYNPTVKASAIAAVLNLASNPINLRVLAKKGALLEALATTVAGRGRVDDIARRQAVLAFLFLANHNKSKKIVAKQHNVVASLSKYGVSEDDDRELKNAALHGVIWLASHM
jgi:hypothetical protein